MSYKPPKSDYDAIFVFGSNLAGRHGAGAAKYAADFLGAEYGVGEGFTGKCYALPTKSYEIENMSPELIKYYVARFLAVARHNAKKTFQVTAIGCGLAGHKAEDISQLFKTSANNCLLPPEFRPYLQDLPDERFWKEGDFS